MRGFSKEFQIIIRMLTIVKEYCKVAAIKAVCMIACITLKSSENDTVRMLFKQFLEIASAIALILLVNNKGNNANLEKSMKMHSMISNAISTQLLEIFTTVQTKNFNKKNTSTYQTKKCCTF